MKNYLITATLLSAATSFAAPLSIVCEQDQRFNNGAFRELILTPSNNGNYLLKTQHMESLNAANSSIQTLAENLNCQVDAKAPIAFCTNKDGQQVTISEVRRVFLSSLDAEKKTTEKRIEVRMETGGAQSHFDSFNAASCGVRGGGN